MPLSPILIFAYNRPDHLRKTVEALRNNFLASQSIVYIFCDGPKTKEDALKVEMVRAYANTVGGFSNVYVVLRDMNYGLANSIINGVTEMLEKFESIIVLEDDLITSPYFLQFMNDSLELYKNDDDVLSVHGYCYPINKETPNTFFLCDPGCYGWGVWRRSWKLFEPDGQKLLNQIIKHQLESEFNYNNAYPYVRMLKNQVLRKNNSWAIRWYASAFLSRKLTLYPGKTLVKHIGYDDTGTHCGGAEPRQDEPYNGPIQVKQIPIKENTIIRNKFSNYLRSIKYSRVSNTLNSVSNFLRKFANSLINSSPNLKKTK